VQGVEILPILERTVYAAIVVFGFCQEANADARTSHVVRASVVKHAKEFNGETAVAHITS
jgi:hypothetical protein